MDKADKKGVVVFVRLSVETESSPLPKKSEIRFFIRPGRLNRDTMATRKSNGS